MKYFFIINENAGSTKSPDFQEQLIRDIKERFRNHQFEIVITKSVIESNEAVQCAVENSFDAIIAAGGDGTIHSIANQLVGRQNIVLGFIPTGSGNDLVKNFGLYNMKLPSILDTIIHGKTSYMDVVKLNNHYFINSAGIGFDAQVAVDYRKITCVKGFLKYALAVGKNIFAFSSIGADFSYNGKSEHRKLFVCELGNGVSAGGGFYLTPDASIDDGLFDVCIIRGGSFLTRIKLLIKVLKKVHTRDSHTHIFKTANLTIKSPDIRIIHCDGELYDVPDGIINASIIQKGLKIIVPR